MRIIYVLHFYQPDFQFKQVLEEVYNKSYKPIFEILKNSKNGKVVFNITASTIEQFNKYQVGNIQNDLQELLKLGKIEILSTSLAHTLLSHSTEFQGERQIQLHNDSMQFYLDWPKTNFKVLFPPELSVNSQVIKLAKKSGLAGLLVSHSSIKDFQEENNKLKIGDIKLFVRSLKLSRMFESPNINNIKILKENHAGHNLKNKLSTVVHDAEIIGFSRPEKLQFFEELMNSNEFEFQLISEELEKEDFIEYQDDIIEGTWEKVMIKNKVIDPHWKNPKNKIHKYQWRLTDLVVNYIENIRNDEIRLDLQTHLDYCQFSCQYWWASSYPFWSPGIISHAAWSWYYLACKVYNQVVVEDPESVKKFIKKAEHNYLGIIRAVTNYDISKWHEENIRYYDEFIHPLKLNFQA